jgi:hypothetical protein
MRSVFAPDTLAGISTSMKETSLPGIYRDALNALRFALYIGLEANVVLIAS